MKEAAGRQDIKIRLGVPFRDGAKRVNCLTGIFKLDVRYDGKVYPCEAFKNDNLKQIKADADNVKDKTLKEIYHSSDYFTKYVHSDKTIHRQKQGQLHGIYSSLRCTIGHGQ